MERRTYLARLGLGGMAALAGCVGDGGDPAGSTDATADPSRSGDDAGGTTASAGLDDDRYPVDRSELSRGAGKDAIPAIIEPAFGPDWSGIEIEVRSRYGGSTTITPRLADGDRVIGVARGGEARAYPLRVLNWHEVVNDAFGDPLLVTYCPLCRTGVTAVRRVDGEAAIFGVSGLLWKSNLVMYDTVTESLWSQVAATAIRGPKAGERLDLVPSTITTLGEWRKSYPEAEVLLPPPESSTVRGPDATRNYGRNPYVGYADSRQVGLGRDDYDDRLHPKTLVVGVANGGVARAYPLPAVEEAGVVNDAVGGLPVVVTTDAGGELVAYVRRVDGESLRFSRAGDTIRAGGSRWEPATGRALDGPHEGTTLERANDRSPMFWFSWADVFPDSEIYGR